MWSVYCRIGFLDPFPLFIRQYDAVQESGSKFVPPKRPIVQFDQAPTKSDALPQTEWPKKAFSNLIDILLVMQNGHVHVPKAIVV